MAAGAEAGAAASAEAGLDWAGLDSSPTCNSSRISGSSRCAFLRHRVRRRLRAWKQAGASRTVLRWLRKGVPLFWKDPDARPPPWNKGRSMTKFESPAQEAFVK